MAKQGDSCPMSTQAAWKSGRLAIGGTEDDLPDLPARPVHPHLVDKIEESGPVTLSKELQMLHALAHIELGAVSHSSRPRTNATIAPTPQMPRLRHASSIHSSTLALSWSGPEKNSVQVDNYWDTVARFSPEEHSLPREYVDDLVQVMLNFRREHEHADGRLQLLPN
eukprot:1120757-Rhodomonas_salina.1